MVLSKRPHYGQNNSFSAIWISRGVGGRPEDLAYRQYLNIRDGVREVRRIRKIEKLRAEL